MRQVKGFTLLELLVALALIGLLSSMAMPRFQGMQQRSQRALAKVALLKAAAWLERSASTQGSYPSNLPEAVWQCAELHYRLQLQSQADAFVLKAEPTGSQTSDACATLTLNQAGERGVEGASAGAGVCWGQ
jgi:type IV pilus assembly protein PilE